MNVSSCFFVSEIELFYIYISASTRYICFYSNFSCAYHDFLSLMLPAIPPPSYVTIMSLPMSPSHMHTIAPIILLSNTNGNGLSADLLCKNTAIGNSAETPHAVLTLVSLMFRCTFIQPISHCVWDPIIPPWAPKCHLSSTLQVHKAAI